MSALDADDLITVIDLFQAAWPYSEWTEKTIAVWLDGLSDPGLGIDGQVAVYVARKLTRKWERCESLAAFLAEYRTEAERQRDTFPALNEPPVNKERRAELMAQMRQMLENPRPHDHHQGWEGCATCVEAVRRDGLRPKPSKLWLAAQAKNPGESP